MSALPATNDHPDGFFSAPTSAPWLGFRVSAPLANPVPLPRSLTTLFCTFQMLTHVFSVYCERFAALRNYNLLFSITYELFRALFCSLKNVNILAVNTFRTLWQKHPGWGSVWLSPFRRGSELQLRHNANLFNAASAAEEMFFSCHTDSGWGVLHQLPTCRHRKGLQ